MKLLLSPSPFQAADMHKKVCLTSSLFGMFSPSLMKLCYFSKEYANYYQQKYP